MQNRFHEIATRTEEIVISMDNIQNLLALYSDHFGSETEVIDPKQAHTSAIFLARLPMLTALFYAIEDGISKAMKDLNAVFDDALTYSKEYKAANQ